MEFVLLAALVASMFIKTSPEVPETLEPRYGGKISHRR